MRRSALAFLVVAMVWATIAAAGLPSAAAGPTRLVVGVNGALDQPAVQNEITALQYPSLTALATSTLDTVPGVADSWTPAPGGWQYTIRDGATWSDGTPVTAADVEYSLATQPGNFPGLEATVVDDRTVVITGLDSPTLLLPVRPAHAYDTDRSVGGGAWRVTDETEAAVTLSVVDRPGRPALDEIVFRSYSDSPALLAALDSGAIDIASGISPIDLDKARAIDGATVIHASPGDQWILQLRVEDPEVRQTIAHAIDRDALVRQVAHDVGRTSPVPIVARGAQWQLDDDVASDLSEQLAYEPDAAPVDATVTLDVPDDQTALQIASFVDAALAEVGIETEIADRQALVDTGANAEVTIVHRVPTDDPADALGDFQCTGLAYCGAEYNELADAMYGATDTQTRIDAVQALTELTATEALEVVLYEPDTLQAFSTERVTGMLREPADERLVVFWPSVEQYYQAVPTATLGGEDISDSVVALLAGVVLAAVVAVVVTLTVSAKRKPRTRSRT